jgi:hypothetical protein
LLKEDKKLYDRKLSHPDAKPAVVNKSALLAFTAKVLPFKSYA